MSGIRTIDDIRLRCVIDEAGCWVWRHATTTANGRPAAYIPEIGRVGTLAHAFKLINGKTCSRSYFPAKCMSRLCCNPAHQLLLTRSQLTKMTTPAPSLLTRGRMAAGRARVAPLKLKPEQYLEIRGSTMLLREIQQRYGVSRCYASQLRSGSAPIFKTLAGGGRAACGARLFGVLVEAGVTYLNPAHASSARMTTGEVYIPRPASTGLCNTMTRLRCLQPRPLSALVTDQRVRGQKRCADFEMCATARGGKA